MKKIILKSKNNILSGEDKGFKDAKKLICNHLKNDKKVLIKISKEIEHTSVSYIKGFYNAILSIIPGRKVDNYVYFELDDEDKLNWNVGRQFKDLGKIVELK